VVAPAPPDTAAMTPRRLTLTSSVAVVAATAAAVLAVAAQAHGTSGTVLRLDVTGTKISTVDVPPLITSKRSPETPGDELVAISKLSGSAGGRRYLLCVVTQTAPSIEKALYACQVTFALSGGTITASGVVHLSGRATAAITGGTGAYAGARGVLSSTSGRDTLTLR
jgi:hypothetical protein